jgi:fibronectin type 3 domain-containing protein
VGGSLTQLASMLLVAVTAACAAPMLNEGMVEQDLTGCFGRPPPRLPCARVTCAQGAGEWIDVPLPAGTVCNQVGQCDGVSEECPVPRPPVVPGPPQQLIAQRGLERIILVWLQTPLSSSYTYNIYRSTSSNGEGAVPYQSGIRAAEFEDLEVGPQPYTHPYYYQVTAVDSAGEGPRSNEASATPIGDPTGVLATADLHEARITVSWSASGASSYLVNRSTSATGPFDRSIPVSGTTYVDANVTGGVRYYYRVSSCVPILGGEHCTGGTTYQVSALCAPVPDSPSTIDSAGRNSIELLWVPTSGATSYNVYRGSQSGGETLYASNVPAAPGPNGYNPIFNDTSTPTCTPFYYQLTANYPNGVESARSAEAQGMSMPPLPGTPTNLTATPGIGQIALSWSAVPGAASYQIQRPEATSPRHLLGSSTSTFYVDTAVMTGTTYTYQVVACIAACGVPQYCGPHSNQVMATPVGAIGGPSALDVFNCIPSEHTVSLWTLDRTSGAQTRVGSLAAQYGSYGECPASGSTPLRVPLTSGHAYTVVAVDPSADQCTGDNPNIQTCQVWIQNVVADSRGGVVRVTLGN